MMSVAIIVLTDSHTATNQIAALQDRNLIDGYIYQFNVFTQLVAIMLNAARAKPATRLYRGKPTKSRKVTSTVRVYEGVKRTLQPGLKPKGAHQGSGGKQATDGKVYVYEPPKTDGTFKCCNGQCFMQYQDPKDDRVVEARLPLFDVTLNKLEARTQLISNWHDVLLLEDGLPVCTIMACKLLGVSKMKLYTDKRIERRGSVSGGGSFTRESKKAESVAAWFMELKEVSSS